MALFGRGKRARRDSDDRDTARDIARDADGDADQVEVDGAGPEGEPGGDRAPARPQGPWDVEDAPDGGPERIDLGGLQVPLNEGSEVRIEMGAEGQVVAAVIVRGESSMQVQGFAAPRSEGIWGQVRDELVGAVADQGGRSQPGEGPLGPELRAEVPAQTPDGQVVLAPARFVGVDGPRWFLRAMITGPAAQDDAAAEALLDDLRGVVVVRGGEAMVVRDLLPLRLPPEVQAAADQAAEQAAAGGMPGLPERGPEITEIR